MVNREGCQLRLCKTKRGRWNVTEGIKGWHIQTRYRKTERRSKGVDKCVRYFRAGGGYGAASYSATEPVCKWVHYRGLMLMLGLGRSAALCNMLKLMRCNKWANPPKARPLWQKHEAFRQARRCLCLSRRQAWSSQRVSVSLREKKTKNKKKTDMTDSRRRVPQLPLPGCRGSAWWEREQRGALVESRTCASERWLTACAVHGGLRGNIWSESGLFCSTCVHVHMDGSSLFAESLSCRNLDLQKKKTFLSYLHVNQTLKLPPSTAVASRVFPHS